MRLERFGGSIVRICEKLPSTRSGRHLQDQLLRSGTAVGAHYSEAQGAQSRKDFIYKLSLSLKEAREARYWLGVAEHAEFVPYEEADLAALRDESTQIVAILQSSKTTTQGA